MYVGRMAIQSSNSFATDQHCNCVHIMVVTYVQFVAHIWVNAFLFFIFFLGFCIRLFIITCK